MFFLYILQACLIFAQFITFLRIIKGSYLKLKKFFKRTDKKDDFKDNVVDNKKNKLYEFDYEAAKVPNSFLNLRKMSNKARHFMDYGKARYPSEERTEGEEVLAIKKKLR